MDERKIAKEALKKEYLKEITCQLIKQGNLSEDAITVDERGEIQFWEQYAKTKIVFSAWFDSYLLN